MNVTTRNDLVKQRVQEIRKHYDTGKKILLEVTANATYGKGQFDKLAEEYRTNADTLRKARQFAKEYSESELEDLCSSMLKIQSTQTTKSGTFGVSHINRIVSVKGRARKALQDKAIQQGWNLRDLTSAISTRFGPRRNGGRSPKIPSSLLGVFEMIEGQCESWRRWNLALQNQWDTQTNDRKSKTTFPSHLKDLIVATSEKVKELQLELETHLFNETRGRTKRHDLMKQTNPD